MRIAYLVNQYPKISHVFIRREILAVEREGCEVTRYSLRRTGEELIDPIDREEATKTQAVLDAGWWGLARAVVGTAARRPGAFWRTMLLAVRVGWRSERGLLRHAIYLAEACVLARCLKRDRIDRKSTRLNSSH